MTKLIALLAVLAAVAWGITATASWITKKKAPRALAPGRTPSAPSQGEEDKAMLGAQMRMVGGLIFAAVMFAALLRVSIGLVANAGIATALTTGLAASGGLLLYSALPAKQQPAKQQPASAQESMPLVPARSFILPGAALLAFLAFVAATALAPAFVAIHLDGVPLAAVAVLFSGASALALHRIMTTLSLPDPRMASLDRSWRRSTAGNLLQFTSGVLLAGLGSTAIMTGLALLEASALLKATAQPVPYLGQACVAGGAAVAVSGVVLLVLAAKGTLSIRATVRKGAPVPITA
ncbi:hypothetical protein ABIB48_002098 [Arthrobacter sp. UYCu511]|uniref:hypothetical protein n=1 Tax=Arthrobacter sp. UYCu511 TaxID=3156337 RepID=UPI00339A860D